MDLTGKKIHVAGSAGKEVPRDRLRRAHAFVSALVCRVLGSGGEMVVFASSEPRLEDSDPSSSQVFDWTVLAEVHRAAVAVAHARRLAIVVASPRSLTGRIPESRRRMLQELVENGSAELVPIPDEYHFGGYIRGAIAKFSDALVAIGGGKGVLDLHRTFRELGRPVLPMGIDIGSTCNDGAGAVGLNRRAIVSPETFFPASVERLRTVLVTRALADDAEDPVTSAEAVARLLGDELSAPHRPSTARPIDVLAVGVLPVELRALLKAFALEGPGAASSNGTRYWIGSLDTAGGHSLSVAVVAVGAAGNSLTAATVTNLLGELSPRLVLLAGIAAGQEGKYRLGEVVIAETVVSYESAVVVDAPVARHVSRANTFSISFRLQQDVTAYLTCGPAGRLAAEYQRLGIALAAAGDSVITRPSVKLATIGSGEKLVRDPAFLARLRDEVHGRIDVVEMEAGGLAAACRVLETPFLVVRGISDFANAAKGDHHHELAANGAALVARDFLVHGLELDRA